MFPSAGLKTYWLISFGLKNVHFFPQVIHDYIDIKTKKKKKKKKEEEEKKEEEGEVGKGGEKRKEEEKN